MTEFSTLFNFFNDCEKALEVENQFLSDECFASLSEEYSPENKTIEHILSFSRSYTTLSSQTIGFVDLNLN